MYMTFGMWLRDMLDQPPERRREAFRNLPPNLRADWRERLNTEAALPGSYFATIAEQLRTA